MSFAIYNVTMLWLQILIIGKKSAEKKFWNILKGLDDIFIFFLVMRPRYRAFKKTCVRNIMLSSFIFIATKVSLILYDFINDKSVNFTLFWIIVLPLVVLQMFVMKFVYYVEVLNFCLLNINIKLLKSNLLHKEMKFLQKSYAICWKSARYIENIFGYGLVMKEIFVTVATLNLGYYLWASFSQNRQKVEIPFDFLTFYYNLYVICYTCQKSFDCAASTAAIVTQKSGRQPNKAFEIFALQLLHQRITFEPKNLFSINFDQLFGVREKIIKSNKPNYSLIFFSLVALGFRLSA